jgi:hypothetical protein
VLVRLIGAREEEILEHKIVHGGVDETAIGIIGRTHDRFASDIEGSVD